MGNVINVESHVSNEREAVLGLAVGSSDRQDIVNWPDVSVLELLHFIHYKYN
jgi:hypothetical protein